MVLTPLFENPTTSLWGLYPFVGEQPARHPSDIIVINLKEVFPPGKRHPSSQHPDDGSPYFLRPPWGGTIDNEKRNLCPLSGAPLELPRPQ